MANTEKVRLNKYLSQAGICSRREADVLIVVDAEHLHCGRPELEGLIASLLCYGIHTFGVKCGWIEPGGRHWMALPNYDAEV